MNTMNTVTIRTLDELLEASQATPAFKAAITSFASGRDSDLIEYNRACPPVKTIRLIMKVLEELPEVEIESISIQGSSGCSNFTGTARIEPGEIKINFNWDCGWRARQQGWTDHWGDPDQIRAARELGYQCFQKFEVSGA